MARNRDFLVIPGSIVHAYNRGVDRRQLFQGPADYDKCMDLLMLAQITTATRLLGYTLMSNHFHFVLHQLEAFAIARFMNKVCRPFTLSVNKRLGRCGPLFDGRYKATVIDGPASLLRVSKYIHSNPVNAKLASKMEEWKYSSCGSYLDRRKQTLVNRDLLWALVGGPGKYEKFLAEFDPSDPPAAEMFLCPEADKIWEIASDNLNKKDIPRKVI